MSTIKAHEDTLQVLEGHSVEVRVEHGAPDLKGLQAVCGIDRRLHNRLGVADRDILDVDPAHGAQHENEAVTGTIQSDACIVLGGDVDLLLDKDFGNRQALQIHAQNLSGRRTRLLRGVRQLDASGLSSATDQDLRLDRYRPQTSGDLRCLVRSLRNGPGWHGNIRGPQQLLTHILLKFQELPPSVGCETPLYYA